MQLGPPERGLAGRRGRNREPPRGHSVLGPCRGGVDTCVTDLTGGAKTALVIYRDGIRMPQGSLAVRGRGGAGS